MLIRWGKGFEIMTTISTIKKAIRLIPKIEMEEIGQSKYFKVTGDRGTYDVMQTAKGTWTCTCYYYVNYSQGIHDCSHIIACKIKSGEIKEMSYAQTGA